MDHLYNQINSFKIKSYYDTLAKSYDENRFSNTYGQYIDKQEQAIVRKILKGKSVENGVDIACGTGRFLKYAQTGLDISPAMIKVARAKFSKHDLYEGSALKTPFGATRFEHALCFHLLMHLDPKTSQNILSEVHRILKPDGIFIVDIPSKHRRILSKPQQANWHGANAFDVEDFKEKIISHWNIVYYQGIAFFPIHRIPSRLRKYFVFLDDLLCKSIFKKYASYLVFVLQKK